MDGTNLILETREEGGGAQGAGDTPDDIRAALESFTQTAEQRIAAAETAATEMRRRLDRVETAQRRPGAAAAEQRDEVATTERRIFNNYLRKGVERMDPLETRTLIVSDDSAGGYLAPDQFSNEVVKNVVRFSPVRAIARVGQTSAGAVLIPRRTGALTSQWVGEIQPRPPTTETYGQARLTVREVSCYVDVSNQMLEDSAIDIVQELSFDFAEEFGRAEGQAFVSGDGVLRPLGFMNDPTVPYVPSGSVTTFGDGSTPAASELDAFIGLYMALAPAYRPNGTWAMNANTIAVLSKLKTTQGTYLLAMEGLGANSPGMMLLGRPIVEMVDMPDIAPNSYPIAFGDFFSAYRIYDRVALSVMRDPFTQGTRGITRFVARRRVAGGLVLSEALVKMKIATS